MQQDLTQITKGKFRNSFEEKVLKPILIVEEKTILWKLVNKRRLNVVLLKSVIKKLWSI